MKKTQLWYMDFIIGVTIFLLIVIVAFNYITSNYTLQGKEINEILHAADRVSETLLGEGIPSNWTIENVTSIGVTTDHTLDISKLIMLKNFSLWNYDRTKSILNLEFDYLLFFQDRYGNLLNFTNFSFIGKPGFNSTNLEIDEPEDITRIARYVVLRNNGYAEIISLNILLWE